MAAILNLEVGAGAVAGGVEDGGGEDVPRFEDIARQDLAVVGFRAAEEFGNLRFVRVSDDPFDAGHGGEFIRGALRVAAGDENAGGGVFAVDAADGGAGVVIGFGRDGAGVEYHDVGRGRADSDSARPRAASWASMAAPSAWVARQPKFWT